MRARPYGCGRWIRTTDLRLMRPPSYQTAPSRFKWLQIPELNRGRRGMSPCWYHSSPICVVGAAGVEPALRVGSHGLSPGQGTRLGAGKVCYLPVMNRMLSTELHPNDVSTISSFVGYLGSQEQSGGQHPPNMNQLIEESLLGGGDEDEVASCVSDLDFCCE